MEMFVATKHLRWKRIAKQVNDHVYKEELVLQQAWEGNKGHLEWREIEIVGND